MTTFTHITTPASLAAGKEHIEPTDCHICGHNTMHFDWCGAMCRTCGADIECTVELSIRRARMALYIQRQQFAEMIGYKCSTVKKYDFCGGSKKYKQLAIDKLKGLYSDKLLVDKCKARQKSDDDALIKKMTDEFFNDR